MDANKRAAMLKETEETPSLHRVMTVSECQRIASTQPNPRQLLGSLLYEGELALWFGDSGSGKSMFSVQFLNSVSTGIPIPPFVLNIEPMKVGMVDYELDMKQFAMRYQNIEGVDYSFSEMFHRIDVSDERAIDSADYSVETYEELLMSSIERDIRDYNLKIVVVDNITFLADQLEKAGDAASLIKKLKRMKTRLNVTIVMISHMNKRPDATRPLTNDSSIGSKRIQQLIDSSLAIGTYPEDAAIRYIKQIKARNSAFEYGTDNVLAFKLTKEDNFSGFTFLKYAHESDYLTQVTREERENRRQQAKELKDDGWTNEMIADKFGVTEGAVRKWLKQ